jgi:DNA polymerase I-like protein with 3'-5' exonuclease and polymerase domains
MVKVVFDIETNGLNPSVIWCIAARIVGRWDEPTTFEPGNVKDFVPWLRDNNVEVLIGQNIINFDIPVIERLLKFKWWGEIEDTLIMSRLDSPSRKGGHSLDAWGERLGKAKGDFGKKEDAWGTYNQEMLEYCIQDVQVTYSLYGTLVRQKLAEDALAMEHEVAKIIYQQQLNGWEFNTRDAITLQAELKSEMFKAEDEVREVFVPLPTFISLSFPSKPYTNDGEVSASLRRQLDSLAYLDEEQGWGKMTYPEFNLGSRKQIARHLIHYGWEPIELTETGIPQVSETILKDVEFPEGKLIARYLMLQKRLGLVSSWIEAAGVLDRIHAYVNPIGAVTNRMTHSKPNLAQVPASGSPYGEECRKLFKVRDGYKLVGMDASGLELRMLAHYMDDADYTKEVVDGDIHTANQMAAGLESRNQAKTFIYAFLYGAGEEKIGSVIGGTSSDGRRLKKDFLANTPALKDLRDRVTKLSEQGTIKGLDDRKLHIRSPHAALNTLLQSAGAIVMKRALVLLDKYAKENSIDYQFVGNIHDEIQTEVKEEEAELFGSLAVGSMIEAGTYYEMNCPLDAEYQVGDTWAETH